MKISSKKYSRLLILITIVVIVLSSCGQKSQEPSVQQQQASQESEKVPEQLSSIENSLERVIKELNGPSLADEEKEAGQNKGGQEQSQEESKKDEESTGGSEKESGGGKEEKKQEDSKQENNASQQKPAPQPPDPWQKISPIINSLHYQWNAYLPMAIKKGANKQLVENFSGALNNLTNAIIAKNATNTLMAASSSYAFIPDFYLLYKTENSPEIKRIRHYIRNSMLNAMTGNWEKAESDLNNLKSSWSICKNIVQKEQQDNASKLDFSIYELERVIKEKNQPLVDIKGRVALSNVKELDKSSK